MKKLALMLSVVFIAACGSGGGGASSVSAPGAAGVSKTGTINLVMADQKSTEKRWNVNTPTIEDGDTYMRITFTNPSLRYPDGKTYKFILEDIKAAADGTFTLPASVTLPLADGYSIETVTFLKRNSVLRNYSGAVYTTIPSLTGSRIISSTPVNSILKKYDHDTFGLVTAPPAVPVVIGPVDISVPVTLPGSIEATIDQAAPKSFAVSTPITAADGLSKVLAPTWRLSLGVNSAVGNSYDCNLVGASTITSPTSFIAGNKAMGQGIFYANSSILRDGENASSFYYESGIVEAPLTFGSGSINLGP